jgi:autotransporter-associated beta strand protein
MKKTTLIFQIVMLLSAAASVAAKRPAASATKPETVIVPYDSGKPLDGQKFDQVYVPYERFVELWEAAKVTRRGLPPEKLDEDSVLSSGRYDATLTETSLRVRGVIELQTFGDDWVSVPLSFKDVKVGSLKLDGQPALFQSDRIVVEKAGHHRIEVEFEIPVKTSRARIAWGIPKTAGTLLTLQLPRATMKAAVMPGNGVVERTIGEQKTVTAALGSTDRVELNIDSSVGLATLTQPALARIDAQLNITPAVEAVHANFDFSFPESQQDRFAVSLDKSLALVKLDVPNLKSWKLAVANDVQTLEIVLSEPARGAFAFSIDAERTAGGQQRHFPFFSAAANRVEQSTALFSAQELEVLAQPSGAFRQIEFARNSDAGLRTVAAFSSTGDKALLDYEVRPAKPVNKAEVSYVYLVNHSKIELIAALKLQVKDRALFDAVLTLPADFAVQAVESERIKDWWRDGDALHVRFKGATPEKTQLVLHLVKQFKSVPDALEITPIGFPEPWTIEGNGIIVANKSVNAAMTVSGAKEIDPQNAATDFRILPPMERKRGFSFKGRDFRASVKLETLPARIAGTWIMSAQAHESWVSVSTHVNLAARQGSADAAIFKLPSAIPEARVLGANVRETTSRVEGAWRIYRVAFQNDLTDQTDFTVDVDLPSDGKVLLPAFEISDVERAEGFVIADNASDYEMQTQPTGLDVAQREQIPFLPEISRNARLFRAQPGWSLEIALTKLEKDAGRSAFVAWAEMTTALRPDGSEWHRAVYHLQNRSLQFLPVKLPDGVELASVIVAGENVRADRGEVGGSDVVLVPLIKTKPGDVSYDVVLVYRRIARGGFFGFMRKSLAEPEVVGITVERTLWNLYVPDENSAAHFGGNMEEILSEVNKTEKLAGMLDELRGLNGILVSSRPDSAAAKNAEQNFKKLAKSLEESTAATDSEDDVAMTAAKGDQVLQQKQKEYVSGKRREIQEELKRQKQSFEGNLANNNYYSRGIVQNGQTIGVTGNLSVQMQTDSPIERGAPLSQNWTSNGGYISKNGTVAGGKDMLDKSSAEGKKLYVNDYVMNVQKDAQVALNASDGTLKLKGANSYAGATVISGGTLGGTAQSSRDGADRNGGVTGGEVRHEMDQIQSEQSLSNRLEAEPEEKPVSAGSSASLSFGMAVAPAPASTSAEQKLGGNESAKVLNSARATNAAVPVLGDIAKQQEASELKADMQSPSSVPAQAQAEKMPQGQPREEPKLSGAISLPVDFPTEGRVYHFKKLKANAGLTLVMTHPQSFERWEWLLAFLVAAAVAKIVFRFADKNRAQAA